MTENLQPAESTRDAHEQLHDHVERIDEEIHHLERLAEDCDIPAIERNATKLQTVLQSVEMNLPPRPGSGEDRQ